jgi:membrane fusion protein (multidrug efflux system)
MDAKTTRNAASEAAPDMEQNEAAVTLKSAPPPASEKQKTGSKKRVLMLVGAVVVVVGVWQGYEWWTTGRFTESTDDAYVKADITTYSAEIAGKIVAIPVADNSLVNAGDVLIKVDDTSYVAAVDQAQAGIASAKASLLNLDEEIKLQHSAVEAAQADLEYSEANLAYARANSARAHKLLETGSGTKVSAEQFDIALHSAEASERKARASLKQAKGQFDVFESQRSVKQATLAEAEAALEIAQNNLSHTVISAQFTGVVGNRGVNPGEYVYAGKKLLSVVPLSNVYVTANFKETQVERFREGMSASVSADMLGGTTFKGHIDSLAPATGSEFALLAPQNATGNFTKIVQRIPVKIILDPIEPTEGPSLRPGTSVVVDINTKEGKQQ